MSAVGKVLLMYLSQVPFGGGTWNKNLIVYHIKCPTAFQNFIYEREDGIACLLPTAHLHWKASHCVQQDLPGGQIE